GEGVQAAPTRNLLRPGLTAAVGLAIVSALLVATLDAMDRMRAKPPEPFDFGSALWRVAHPDQIGGWVQLAGIAAFALVGGLFIAATRAGAMKDTKALATKDTKITKA